MTHRKAFEMIKDLEKKLRKDDFSGYDLYAQLSLGCEIAMGGHPKEAGIWKTAQEAIALKYKLNRAVSKDL